MPDLDDADLDDADLDDADLGHARLDLVAGSDSFSKNESGRAGESL